MKYMIVQRVEQQIIKKNNPVWNVIDKYCFYSKNVYNEANYLIRQEFIKNGNWIRAYDIQKIMQSMECYKECGSQAAQKTIQLIDKNWKSFFKTIKDWKKNPNKYLGRPKLPKYLKKDGRQVFTLKNIQCSLEGGFFRIAFKPFNQYTVKSHANGKLLQCRFVPKGSDYVMEVVYEKEVPDIEKFNNSKIAIDLGIDNFATITNNIGLQPIAIKGGVIKSINQYYNKRKSEIQSELKLKNNKDWSNRLQQLTSKRNNKVKNWIHLASKTVVSYCVENNIDTIVCGYNKTWKQNCSMGKKVNQNFVTIPYDTFISQLEYKCQDVGIQFILTEESYTSGTSFLDREEPIKKYYDKSRRVHRGLFKSNNGTKINADVNGSYQIMKKVFPEEFSNGIEGAGCHPLSIKIA